MCVYYKSDKYQCFSLAQKSFNSCGFSLKDFEVETIQKSIN